MLSSHRAHNEALLAEAEATVIGGDADRARALLHDLHWFAHDDPGIHADVHRLSLRLARDAGDVVGAVKELLPIAFAAPISWLEQRGAAFEDSATIAAPPEIVYRVLTDVAAYAEWNPWLVRAEGDARVGGSVVADVKLGAKPTKADHRVIVSTPGRRFAWEDVGWFTPLARGRRFRTLEREGETTRLAVRLVITGPLSALVVRLHGRALRDGLAAETRALVERCESRARIEREEVVHA